MPRLTLAWQVEFANSEFWLVAAEGGASAYRKKSSVLAIEEVSYVSSAYIPACLRHGGRPTLSNAHRVHECTSSAGGTIRDDLDEVITLNSVSLIVGEYIPFGSNQMVQLNHTMGSPERVLGGFYTAAVQVRLRHGRALACMGLSDVCGCAGRCKLCWLSHGSWPHGNPDSRLLSCRARQSGGRHPAARARWHRSN